MEYLPPLVNNSTFNVANFNYQDSYLTYYTADNRYIRKDGPNVYYGLNTFTNDVNIQASLSVYYATINNSLSIGGGITITGKIACHEIISPSYLKINNITCSSIKCDTIQCKSFTGIFLYANNLSYPIIKSVPDCSIMYTNLNVSDMLGITGNNCNILLYPNYGVQIWNNNSLIFTISNETDTILYSPIIFFLPLQATSIRVFFDHMLL